MNVCPGTSQKADIERKKNELILAAYIAPHSSLRSVDHLTDIIDSMNRKGHSENTPSTPAEVNIHRLHKTKCSALVQKVVAPSLLSALLKDAGESPFSLIIIDESTAVSTEKLICICIKYYSESKTKLLYSF
jgi:hypothetical protein